MKLFQYKNITSTNSNHFPFFQKESNNNFFGKSYKPKPFFNSNTIQTKLTIGQPHDIYEKEADTMADKVVRLSDNSVQTKPLTGNSFAPFIQRKCAACEQEDSLQKKWDSTPQAASPNIESSLNSVQGSGSFLPIETRSQMESSFGADFSNVQIHNDNFSVQMNKDLHAQAFTHGNDIYFNSGKYSPGTTTGKWLLAHELTHVMQQGHTNSSIISRKISVENPDISIPNPAGNGLVQTNVVTVLDYLSQLCPDTGMVANSGSIDLVDSGFCFPSVKQDDGTFKSPSELSAHPVSCECICEMITDPFQAIIIRIDDTLNGNAGTNSTALGATISVPSPNIKTPAIRGATGETIDSPHFIVLGHELCGHHFLEKRGSNERENTQNIPRGGHDPAITRENLLREEHGLEKRGTFRDPCCGIFESTEQDLKKTSGKCGDAFEKQKDEKNTVANECKHWREEYNKLNGTSFTTDDVIPEKPLEILPATWRLEIFFKKNMPLEGDTLEQSLTEDGKGNLQIAVILLNRHPEFSAQLSGNASSDKPASDPTFNKRLANRRAELVLADLLKKGFDEKRFKTFDSDCEKLQEGIHNCSDSESEKKSNEFDRNVEVKLF